MNPLQSCLDGLTRLISTQELSALLADLYTAPLEPEKWQCFIDRLCALTHTTSGWLLGSHAIDGNGVLAGGGVKFDTDVIRLYNTRYGASDPYEAPFLAKPRVGLIHGEELVPQSSLRKTEFYNNVLSPFGMEYISLVCYGLEDGQMDFLSLWHDSQHGAIDASNAVVVANLIPHLRTVMRLHRKLVAGNAVQTYSECVLDAMSIAAFLVNEHGQVRHMNRLASDHVAKEDGLGITAGRLVGQSKSVPAGQLEQMIAHAATNEMRSFDQPPGGSLRFSHFTVSVLPAPEKSEFYGRESYAVVFVVDERKPPKSRGAIMRQLYGLTPAEARVADRMLDGFESREIAEQLGVTIESCRFQIKRILMKTGCRRQAELIRLMLSLPGTSL